MTPGTSLTKLHDHVLVDRYQMAGVKPSDRSIAHVAHMRVGSGFTFEERVDGEGFGQRVIGVVHGIPLKGEVGARDPERVGASDGVVRFPALGSPDEPRFVRFSDNGREALDAPNIRRKGNASNLSNLVKGEVTYRGLRWGIFFGF